MVQRYELKEMSRNPFESYRCLEEDNGGDWVQYADYLALLKEHNRLKEAYNARCARLNGTHRKLRDAEDKLGEW